MKTLRQELAAAGKSPFERSMQELLSYGIAAVDKPVGPTSHEVSSFVKKILGLKKTGHTGTLDADVSGVLLVLLENSCKTAKYLMTGSKKYVCVMELGEKASEKELEAALHSFRGKVYQTPPLESAVAKVLRVRQVFDLRLLEVQQKHALLYCHCEAGFYMRKLCYDLGEVLGCGGKMVELRRTEANGITEKEAHSLQELSDACWLWREKGEERELRKMVKPIEQAIGLKKVVASDYALKSISTGANLAIPGIISLDEGIKQNEFVSVLTQKGELVCVARALLSAQEILEKDRGLAFDVERVVHSFA